MPRYNLLTPAGDSLLDDTNDAVRVNIVAGGSTGIDSANMVSGCTAKIETTDATNVIVSDAGSGLRYYVTDIMVTNSDATVGTLVTIQDTASTPVVLWQGYAAPAGGGFACHFGTPLKATANKHIQAVCGTASAEVYVCVSAYKAA